MADNQDPLILGEAGVIAKRTAQYRSIRDKLKEMDEAHEKAKEPLLKIKALLEGYFEKFLEHTGQQSAATPSGTVHWNSRTTATLEDAEAFMQFVISTQSFDLIDRRANATAVREYAETNKSLPPGVNLSTIRTVGVKAPTAKAAAKAAR